MQEIASFTFDWPKGPSEVLITGSFDGWQNKVPLVRQADGSHTITVPLKFDKDHQKVFFKFIVDGEWLISNEYKKEFDNNGFENNFVEVADVRDLLKDQTKGMGSRIPESGGLMALSSMGNKEMGKEMDNNKMSKDNSNKNNHNDMNNMMSAGHEDDKVNTMPVKTEEAETNVFKNPGYAMAGPGPVIPGSMPEIEDESEKNCTKDAAVNTKDVKVNVPGQFNILPVETDPASTNAFANNSPLAGPGPVIPSGDQMEAFTKFRNERGEYVTKEQMEHEKGLKVGDNNTLTPTAGVSVTNAAAIATGAAFSKRLGAKHINLNAKSTTSDMPMKKSSGGMSSTAAVAVTTAASIASGAAFSKKIGAKHIDFNASPSMSDISMKKPNSGVSSTAAVAVTNAAAIASGAAFSKKIGAKHIDLNTFSPPMGNMENKMTKPSGSSVSSTAAVAVTNAAVIAIGAAYSRRLGVRKVDLNAPSNMMTEESNMMKTEPKMMKAEPKMMKTDPKMMKTDPKMMKTDPKMMKTDPKMMKTEPQMKKSASLTDKMKENEKKMEERRESLTEKMKETEKKMEERRESTRERIESKIMETNNKLDQRMNKAKSEVQGNAMHIKEKVNEMIHPEDKDTNLKKEPTPMAVEAPMNSTAMHGAATDAEVFMPLANKAQSKAPQVKSSIPAVKNNMEKATSSRVPDSQDPAIHAAHPPKSAPVMNVESDMKHADQSDPRLYAAHGTPDNSKEKLPQSNRTSRTATPSKKTPSKTPTSNKAMKNNASSSTPAREEKKKKGLFTKIKKFLKNNT
ncbi:Cruciform DNA-recognizing protein 1 [Nakaseomyces bracarensis]|uniref:Cruciform DNA-recognizing protein 1 n=1 Tax=Nakaseomyces bracarensis TaxID=273131 RepID=A0ABR4NNB9_9SACH